MNAQHARTAKTHVDASARDDRRDKAALAAADVGHRRHLGLGSHGRMRVAALRARRERGWRSSGERHVDRSTSYVPVAARRIDAVHDRFSRNASSAAWSYLEHAYIIAASACFVCV